MSSQQQNRTELIPDSTSDEHDSIDNDDEYRRHSATSRNSLNGGDSGDDDEDDDSQSFQNQRSLSSFLTRWPTPFYFLRGHNQRIHHATGTTTNEDVVNDYDYDSSDDFSDVLVMMEQERQWRTPEQVQLLVQRQVVLQVLSREYSNHLHNDQKNHNLTTGCYWFHTPNESILLRQLNNNITPSMEPNLLNHNDETTATATVTTTRTSPEGIILDRIPNNTGTSTDSVTGVPTFDEQSEESHEIDDYRPRREVALPPLPIVETGGGSTTSNSYPRCTYIIQTHAPSATVNSHSDRSRGYQSYQATDDDNDVNYRDEAHGFDSDTFLSLDSLPRQGDQQYHHQQQQDEEEEQSSSGTIMIPQIHDSVCGICLFEYQLGDLVALSFNTHCTHEFHLQCITDWLIQNSSCPTCRREYLVR